MNKAFLKKLVPPILLDLIKRPSPYGYFGDYKTWQDARLDSLGYDSDLILDKVRASLLKVKKGEIPHERDSVRFGKIEYSWPVIAGLLWIASLNKNKLEVLDFGGSLGSSYFQNRIFLRHVDLTWRIAEQKNFVEAGRASFEDERLKFIDSIREVKPVESSVFLASSSLQYLEDPYALMHEAIAMGFPHIILDRTVLLPDSDRICVQKVRPEIYDASYPVWAISEKKLLELFASSYTMIADFEAIGTKQIRIGNKTAYQKGFIFERKR